MALNVAVQMDPIERINIRGDSTFALLLEAQARGHELSYYNPASPGPGAGGGVWAQARGHELGYYTPDRLAQVQGRVFASVQALAVRDTLGDHFTLGESRR